MRIPHSVVVGFTVGIAGVIFLSTEAMHSFAFTVRWWAAKRIWWCNAFNNTFLVLLYKSTDITEQHLRVELPCVWILFFERFSAGVRLAQSNPVELISTTQFGYAPQVRIPRHQLTGFYVLRLRFTRLRSELLYCPVMWKKSCHTNIARILISRFWNSAVFLTHGT